MAADVIIPQVADIHFDDLSSLFRLRVTFVLETPAGNFEKEIVVTGADLATVIQQLVQIWAGGVPTSGSVNVGYQWGDIGAVRAFFNALTPPAYSPPSLPAVPAGDATPDPTWGTYVGTAGVHPWGTS